MRYFDREQVSPPKVLFSKRVEELHNQILEYAANLSETETRRRAPIDDRFLQDPELIDAVQTLFRGACAYCETPILGRDVKLSLHHHRPPGFAADPSGQTDMMHYVWLAYDWDNMLYVCTGCRLRKKNQFWVHGERGPISASIEELRKGEHARLIDPCFDDPGRVLLFRPNGEVHALGAGGQATIDLLDLDRRELRESRRDAVQEVANQIIENNGRIDLLRTGATDRISAFVVVRAAYAGATSSAVINFLAQRGLAINGTLADALERVSQLSGKEIRDVFEELISESKRPEDSSDLEDIPRTTVHKRPRRLRLKDLPAAGVPIREVVIRNFKALKQISFDLPETVGEGEQAPCMIVLGENATGKSSVLEAIALALIGTEEAVKLDRLLPEDIIMPEALLHRPDATSPRGEASGPLSVAVRFRTDVPDALIELYPKEGRFDGSDSCSKILLAYGPRRFFPTRRTRRLQAPAHHVRSLFDPMAIIPNPADWLLICKERDFDAVARALREILMLPRSYDFSREGGRIVIQTDDGHTPLSEMSMGYKSVIAMATDIMRELLRHFDNLEFASAVVLIDEIETHLHPRWKMRIMSLLRRALPEVQFIVTTHDPLCLRGMFHGEVFVLQRSPTDRRVEQLVDLPDIRGMRAEQLLTSEFFGLGSTDPETEVKLQIYHALLARRETLSSDEQEELDQLRGDLRDSMVVGDTLMEQAVGRAILAAEAESQEQVPKDLTVRPERKEIVDSVLNRLKQIKGEA